MTADLLGGTTMGAMLKSALSRYPDRIAFVDGERTVSYSAFAKMVAKAVALFDSLGLTPGDTVAQLSGNRPEVYAVIAAVYMSNLRSMTLHAQGSEADHAFILDDSEAALFVVDPAYSQRAQALRKQVSGVAHWFAHEKVEGLSSFWETAGNFDSLPLEPKGGPEDIIRLAYTGGTTGKPKGVLLSNRSLVTNTLLTLAGNTWPDEIRFLCPTPISHGAGSMILPTLWHGGTFILQRGFDAGALLEAFEYHKVTMTFLVPTMIYAILDHPKLKSVDCSSLHTLLYGAAPILPARVREALKAFGPVLVQGYGQTEAPNTILTLSQADHLSGDDRLLASAGRPYPGIEVKLLDEELREVPRGEPGELCVRGPLIMSGYWKRPEETAEAFRGDWLHTGDVALMDDNGFYFLVDRKKDMIISGGFNVYPGEVERVLAEHPAVAQASVIGVADPKWGEAVTAVIVLRSGFDVSAEELIGFVRAEKGPINTPKTIHFVSELPVTALGKPDKKALRAQY